MIILPLSPISELNIHFKILLYNLIGNRSPVVDAPLSSLMDSVVSPKVKTTKKGVGACSLTHNILGVEGDVGVMGWGLS
jgi:hypothetical protein